MYEASLKLHKEDVYPLEILRYTRTEFSNLGTTGINVKS